MGEAGGRNPYPVTKPHSHPGIWVECVWGEKPVRKLSALAPREPQISHKPSSLWHQYSETGKEF